jgi:hypothetical protein
MALPRTSAVEGTLTDEFGDPLPLMGIQVSARQFAAGRQRLVPVQSRILPMPTDDKGHYRISGVEPGEYFVEAMCGAFADGVILKVTEGTALRGHLAFEESPLPKPVDLVHVVALPTEFDTSPMAGGPPPFEMHPDWTFEVSHLSGQRRIMVSVSSPTWTLKKVTRGGIDITDATVDFRTKDVDDVEVLLTPRITRVSGAVSDSLCRRETRRRSA